MTRNMLNKERHSSAAVSLFFRYRSMLLVVLVLFLLGFWLSPQTTHFTPIPIVEKSFTDNNLQQLHYPTPPQRLSQSDKKHKKPSKASGSAPKSHLKEQKPQPFYPDTASLSTWVQLGFSRRQAQVIINYRTKCGGFRNTQQIKKCFVIDSSAYQRIAPLLLFRTREATPNKLTKTEQQLVPFNPDTASTTTFCIMGFSPRQAQTLINYRKALGGRFGTPERFAKSFVVDSAMFERLKPYLVFE